MRRARSRTLARALALMCASACLASIVDASAYGSRATRNQRRAQREDAGAHFRAYTWGIGGERVGRPSDPSKLPPARVELEESVGEIVAVAASGHTAVVNERGELYTAGRNSSAGGGGHGSPPIDDSGQIGRGGDPGALERVRGDLVGEVVTSVGCGRYHTVVSTGSGRVYAFGLNDVGQLGTHGIMGEGPKRDVICDSGGRCEGIDQIKDALAEVGEKCIGGPACRMGEPARVKFENENVQIKSVVAGRYSSAAITKDGDVFVWGLNSCGDVSGHRDELVSHPRDSAKPRRVNIKNVVSIDIGYTNMIFRTSRGAVYTCDTGFTGYTAVAVKAKVAIVQHDFANEYKAIDVAAGRCHYAVATEAGTVFTWGCQALGREGDKMKPQPVGGDLASRSVETVAAGEYFTLVTTDSGEIYGWGADANGQLGVQADSSNTFHSPVQVNVGPKVGTALAVAAGYQHSVAILQQKE